MSIIIRIALNNTSKIILAGFMIALFSTTIPGFLDNEANAAAPVISSVKVTDANEITVVYAATTTGDKDDYTDLRLTVNNEARTVSSMTGSTADTHVLVISGTALPTGTTATMDIGVGLTDTAGGQANVADADQGVTDGQVPVSVSAITTSQTTIDVTFSEDMIDTASDLNDYTIGGTDGDGTIVSKTVSGAILTLTIEGYVMTPSQTITFTYDGEANELEDTGTLLDLADIASLSVSNVVTPVRTDCYDCVAPTLSEAQITISSDDYNISTGDELTHITANVGDEVSLLLKITDNRTIDTIPFVGLYTNFVETPDDMSLFYTNHYDKNLKNISTSFYEWNIRSDDTAYDYDGTVHWSNTLPTMVNDPVLGEHLMTEFTMKFNDSMGPSQIIVKISDASGNYSYEAIPVTLEVMGDASLDFTTKGKQKLLGFFDESVLSIMISELNTSGNISTPVSSLLGISDESLPTWTSNLAEWMAEDKINSGDLIVAVEYLINQ
jgi:hypothetical protein